MKIVSENILVSKGTFGTSEEIKVIKEELREAIESVNWFDKTRFLINPVRYGNGVVPIKKNFISLLVSRGWKAEQKMSLAPGMQPGKIDVIKETSEGIFAVEWETGNVSSSHRALNKIAAGVLQGHLIGGYLILPVRELAQYLTDRIGNFEEIEPYFHLWKNVGIVNGELGVMTFIYDDTSKDAPLIPKGTDGNAEKDPQLEFGR
jgi:hypothetical protein